MERYLKKYQKDSFESIIEMIPFGLLLVGGEHDIEYYNRQFAEIFGYDHRKISSLSGWLTAAFPQSDYRRQVRGILFYELPYTQTDGKRTYTATVAAGASGEKIVQFTAMEPDNGKILLICEDVTQERKLSAQLQHAQKLEAIGLIAGGVAHEINNILTGIQGYTSLMLMDMDPSHPHYAKLQAVEAQINSGSDLIEQLLQRSRGERFDFKAVALNDFLADLAGSFRQTHSDIDLREQYAAHIWAVESDVSRLEQAFQDILTNAVILAKDNCVLTLKTENFLLDKPLVSLNDIKSGPYVRVSLALPGTRIDDLTRKRLLGPAAAPGSGSLQAEPALSFAHGVIQGHGGTITIESDVFRGTTYCVYLPASSKTPHKKKQPLSVLKNPTGQETILLVDDEKVITEVAASMLTSLGYEVLIASNGEEAVSVYQEHQTRIDLVIMDIVMPGMGGGEAIDLIRAINPSAKVMLCSGYSLDGAVEAIMKKGVQIFLKKPFKLKDFCQKIRDALDG